MIEESERFKGKIVNCEFVFKCPQKWEKMEATGAEDVRFCGECQKDVFFAETHDQLFDLAGEGNCVAVWREVEKPESFGEDFENVSFGQAESRYEMLAGIIAMPEDYNNSSNDLFQASGGHKKKPDPFKRLLKFMIVAALTVILMGAVIVTLLVSLR